MNLIRIILAAGGASLVFAIIWASGADGRGLGPVLGEMLSEPWSIVTLVDLYLGFLIAAILIAAFERNVFVTICWALPIFVLGNVWTAAWVAYRLPEIVRRFRG